MVSDVANAGTSTPPAITAESSNQEINNFMPTLSGTSAPTTSTDNTFFLKSLAESWFAGGGSAPPQSPMSIIMQNNLQNLEYGGEQQQQQQQQQQFDVNSLINYDDVMYNFLNSPSINIEPNFDTNTLKVSTPSMVIESPFEMFERAQGSNVTNDFIAALKKRSSENLQGMSFKIPQNGTFTRLIGGGSHGVSAFRLNTKNMQRKRMSKLARTDDALSRSASSSGSSSSSSHSKQSSEERVIKRGNDVGAGVSGLHNARDIPTPDYSSTTLSSPSSVSLVTPGDFSKTQSYSKTQVQQAQQALDAIQKLKIKEESGGSEYFASLLPDSLDDPLASSLLDHAAL